LFAATIKPAVSANFIDSGMSGFIESALLAAMYTHRLNTDSNQDRAVSQEGFAQYQTMLMLALRPQLPIRVY
jgi:hypothetical protein